MCVLYLWCSCFVFFFKQKTAYEMRISDWSSDVCSSDLDLSPARSGTAVVAVCGIAAAMFLSRGADWPEGLIVPGLILLGTVVVAIFVYRFASSHASEIGEARFNTVATSKHQDSRTEERRVGKGCVSKCRSWW